MVFPTQLVTLTDVLHMAVALKAVGAFDILILFDRHVKQSLAIILLVTMVGKEEVHYGRQRTKISESH